MAVQTNYSDTIPVAYPGQVADMVPATFISRTVEDSAGIALGVPVYQGSNDGGCSATGTLLLGISVRERSLNPETPNIFAENESARIIAQGAVWVTVSSAVSAGEPVTLTAGNEFSASGATAMSGAVFDTSADADGLARIRLTGGFTDTSV